MATDEQKEKMLDALEAVIDPELGIDIVNLGLIYEVDLDDDGLATVNMTLTTMGCPLTDYLSDNINQVLKALPDVKDVEIELVWYPQWTPDMMSRYARISLGIG
ncbi:metal-sulfur cluster assembly factor [Lapidilactobacillus bayanensis]|uniref:metal-sulfur cluster assembly factor n=1 Tax=Lapidilactobacillus bayanensis TaxID=2485998 RepID=UPI000F78C75E|nr:metal-sulfur cluster assembly factor [Lapidilactobacillus bayanensis]